MRTPGKIQTIFYFLVLISITAITYGKIINHFSPEFDETTYVSHFIDGDSFEIPGDEVRLADINAPEWNEQGGEYAKTVLNSLLDGKTIYLDTDQRFGRDPYGRLVAVVYVIHDPVSYRNVNKALLSQGVVELSDYSDNEFNPSNWREYVTILNTQDKIKYLVISTGLGFFVCLLFYFGFKKL